MANDLTNVRRGAQFDPDSRYQGDAGPVQVEPRSDLDSDENVELLYTIEAWWAEARDLHATNRREQLIDADFYDNDQYTEEDRAAMEERFQAPLVYNIIAPAVDWIVGTERQLLENVYFGVMEVVQINSSVVTTIDPRAAAMPQSGRPGMRRRHTSGRLAAASILGAVNRALASPTCRDPGTGSRMEILERRCEQAHLPLFRLRPVPGGTGAGVRGRLGRGLQAPPAGSAVQPSRKAADGRRCGP